MTTPDPPTRLAFALLALLAYGCVSGDDAGDPGCAAGERRVCRSDTDCRCGPSCAPGSACPRVAGENRVCGELTAMSGVGVCVDVSWATNAPAGMVRCGAHLCPATSSCIDWGGSVGVGCGDPCRTNPECASGCCTAVSDRAMQQTFDVCAPDTTFRCLTNTPAGQSCDPACAAGESCVAGAPRPRCARACAADGDCPGACCAEVVGGGRACAATRSGCGAPIAPACTSLDACVTVTYAARGDHCGGSADSVEVRVRNDCTRAADVQICYERRDGTCSCGLHRAVEPHAEGAPPFWGCDLTGRFRVWSRQAGDAPGCFPGTCI